MSRMNSEERREKETVDLKKAGFKEDVNLFNHPSLIELRSQNLDLSTLPKEAIVHVSNDMDRSSCGVEERGSSLADYYLILRGKYLFGDGRGGIVVIPGGKKFFIAGLKGDPWTSSSMRFQALSDEEAANIIEEERVAEQEALTAAEAEMAAKEAERRGEDLRYRSTIRGLTEGLGLTILCRQNTASCMPARYMVCRHDQDQDGRDIFIKLISFCSQEGCYIFLRKIVKFVRQTNGGRITIEAWEKLDLAAALRFALDECNKHAEQEREGEGKEV